MTSSPPWPPPPDLASLQELTREADIEGFLAEGGPADEYDTEAEQILAALQGIPTEDLTVRRILPILRRIWAGSFGLDEEQLIPRSIALQGLAAQIERFFGPGAQPGVRGR